MKKWNISVFILVLTAIFTMSGIQAAIGADAPGKVEKAGKPASSAETKMMNKTDKAPKMKTMPNKTDKTKVKTGPTAQPFIPGGSPISAATNGVSSNAGTSSK